MAIRRNGTPNLNPSKKKIGPLASIRGGRRDGLRRGQVVTGPIATGPYRGPFRNINGGPSTTISGSPSVIPGILGRISSNGYMDAYTSGEAQAVNGGGGGGGGGGLDSFVDDTKDYIDTLPWWALPLGFGVVFYLLTKKK